MMANRGKWYSGIRGKIITVFLAIVTLDAAAMFLFLPAQFESSYTSQALRHAQSVADMAAFTVSPAMVFSDTAACEEAILPLRQNHDLLVVVVFDTSGRRFYTFVRKDLVPPPEFNGEELSEADLKRFLVSRSPIQHASKRYGTVLIGYSLDEMKRGLSTVRSTFTVEVILFLLVGTFSVLVVSMYVTQPLRRMVKTVQAIAQGNLKERVKVTTHDEVGLLGTRFNEMVSAVQAAQDELRQLNRDLERRVVERTLDLEREIEVRKKMDDQLKTSLHEKEVLLKEIHHRVKNNLQVISSMLSLQGNAIKDVAVRNLLRESQGRVRSMAAIHEMLYRSGDFVHIDFAKYVQTLASQLFRSYSVNPTDVQLDLKIHAVPLSIDTAIPCGLIINELISNALKYAFPDGRTGRIDVTLKPIDGEDEAGGRHSAGPAATSVCLTVSDDGIGLPESVDPSKSPTLGLMLVTTLTEQLNGTLELERNHGTAFRITF